MTGTGISEGKDLQEIPQETKEEMGGRYFNFNATKRGQGVKAKFGTIKVPCYIHMGTYKDVVLNYNFSDDLLSGEDTTEWPEIEAT